MAQIIRMIEPRRGRVLTRDGRERFNLFPEQSRGRSLYALGFSNGHTKIGIARLPRKRIRQHWIASDSAVTWAHVFGSFPGRLAEHIERRACSIAAERSQRIRMTETFIGLSRADALACVRLAVAEAERA